MWPLLSTSVRRFITPLCCDRGGMIEKKPFGCLTASGLVIALLTVLVVVVVGLMRGGATDDELAAAVAAVWAVRADRYSELRSEATEALPRPEMFALGG